MNRLSFLKAALASVVLAPFARLFGNPKPKDYIEFCPYDRMVGLLVEVSETRPAEKWTTYRITSQCGNVFQWQGRWVDNARMNKFWGKPIGGGPARLLCFTHARDRDGFVVNLCDNFRAWLPS